MRIQRYIAKDMRTALGTGARSAGTRCGDPVVRHGGRSGRSRGRDRRGSRRANSRAARSSRERAAQPRTSASSRVRAARPRSFPRRCCLQLSPRSRRQRRRRGTGAQRRRQHRRRAGQRSEGHAPHARIAARDARLERHVAPLAAAGRDAQGTGAARHHAGPRRFAGAQDSRQSQFLRGAPLRARDHRAHRAGDRRSLARKRRTHRVRRSRRRRQDHLDRQARRALGAAPRPAPRRAGLRRRGAHRRARTDAHARPPARRHGAHRRRRRRTARAARRPVRTAPGAHRHRRAPARATRTSRVACACVQPGADRTIETALVLPASTQAGAIEEALQRFALARPSALRASPRSTRP